MQTITQTNTVVNHHAALTALAVLDRAAAVFEGGRVAEGMDAILDCLRETREQLSSEDWTAFARYAREHHDVRRFVYECPLTKRACDKPRGYAGDAVMMDYLYGIHCSSQAAAETSRVGREVYRFMQGSEAPSAVRYRRRHIAQRIDKMAATRPQPSVLAVAAGHLREAEICESLTAGRIGRFVALDADAQSLREVEARYAYLGVETIHASVRHILARKVTAGTFDFVYAAGLYDYLSLNVAQALTARLFDMVNPGGQMLIPNFAPQVRDRGYMETFMDWTLIYRDEFDMAQLVEQIDPARIESYDVYTDPSKAVVYLLVKKANEVRQ